MNVEAIAKARIEARVRLNIKIVRLATNRAATLRPVGLIEKK